MFHRFYRYFEMYRRFCRGLKRPLFSRNGQIAIIMIFVIAIGLIYYAIVFNLGKISQSKTTATIASNTAAAQMGSLMASYGEQLFQETLGGHRKYCKGTSVFVAIIGVILAILIIIFAPYIAPLIGVTVSAFTAAAVVGLVFAITALALNVAVIQPGITRMWNEMISAIKSPKDQFVERGIQTALVAAANDPVQVPDLLDFDRDGIFERNPEVELPNAKDLVSRFALYYTERLRAVQAPDSSAIEEFINRLDKLVYGDGSWGLTDPVDCVLNPGHPCCGDPPPSICNPCCVSDPDLRPPELNCGDPTAICASNSPYHGGPVSYPWIYRGPIEDETNGFQSFAEQIGEDDPHPVYNRNPNTGPYAQQTYQAPGIPGNYYFDPAAPTLPRIEDTSGYYSPADSRTGIFADFYKLRDWGTDLRALDYEDDECHWCDSDWRGGSCPDPVYPELDLLNSPDDPAARFAGGACVDKENTTSGPTGPQLLDLVGMPDIFLKEDECGAFGSLGDPGKGWKSGSDRFCSSDAPYDAGCAKNGGDKRCNEPGPDGDIPVDCDCGDPNAGPPELWRDDDLDAIVWQIQQAAQVFSFLFETDATQLAWMFEEWYDIIAEWIEPGCDYDGQDECPSYTKKERGLPKGGGIMWVWLDTLQNYVNKINEWLEPSEPYESAGCRNGDGNGDPVVWCVPPGDQPVNEHNVPECPGVTVGEAATFGIGPDRGKLDSVIACLDWNANDELQWTDSGGNLQTAVGNAEKFHACIEECAQYDPDDPQVDPAETCGYLPRSLLGDPPRSGPFDPSWCEDSQYMEWVAKSEIAAQNQIPKLRKRREVLEDRRDEMTAMRDNMQTALDKLAEFICGPPNGADPTWNCGPGQGTFNVDDDTMNSPVEKLINARKNWDDNRPKTESVVVYAWQGPKLDEPRDRPPGLDPYEGYWHAVKVEVRVPERCNNTCGGGNNAGLPEAGFPKINTYTKGFLGSTRCFELVNTTGRVKVRVIRYDEDHDASTMMFPGGRKIWDIQNTHPDARSITGRQPGPGGIMNPNACRAFVLPQLRDPDEVPLPYIGNAFMLNEPPRPGTPPELEACWDLVHQNMLEFGHSTETCVEYYFGPGGFGGKGMHMKFVPCDKDFLDGKN